MKKFTTFTNSAINFTADDHAAKSRIAARSGMVYLGLNEFTEGNDALIDFQLSRARDPKQAPVLLKELANLKRHFQVGKSLLDLEELAIETIDQAARSLLSDERKLAEMRRDAHDPKRCRLVIATLNRLSHSTGTSLVGALKSIKNTAIFTANKAGFQPVSARAVVAR